MNYERCWELLKEHVSSERNKVNQMTSHYRIIEDSRNYEIALAISKELHSILREINLLESQPFNHIDIEENNNG